MTTSRHPVPGLRLERPHWEAGRVVVGVDEVGRGAWAGPLTVGAVALLPAPRILGLRDSKVLGAPRREELARRIHARARAVGIGEAAPQEIDARGLSGALRLAARRAVAALGVPVEVLLLDGSWDFLAHASGETTTVVRGDSVSASIAAASIVAKVHRDAVMREHACRHAVYDLAANKGYGSVRHAAGLDQHGPCVLHRFSFRPVAERADRDAVAATGDERLAQRPSGASTAVGDTS